MQVIIEESEYKYLCDIRDKYFSGIKSTQIQLPSNTYYGSCYLYTNDEALDKLIEINNDLKNEIKDLKLVINRHKNKNFWNKLWNSKILKLVLK